MADTNNPQPESSAAPATRVVQIQQVPPSHHKSGLKSFFSFLAWVFTGFGLIGMIRRKGEHYRIEEVVVYSVHRSFFLWPVILTGFIGAALVKHHIHHAGVTGHEIGKLPHIVGWIYIWVILYTFVVMMFDVGTLNFLLFGFVFAFLWVTSTLLNLKDIHFLSNIVLYMKSLKPSLDPGFATVLSWLLLGPWVGSLFRTFTRGRKSFSPNGIEEWFLGDGREITDRAGLHFTSRYSDLLKMLIGIGSGDLEAADSSGKIIKRWPNILFLAFFWKRLDEILHERAAVVENTKDQPVEVEEVRKA